MLLPEIPADYPTVKKPGCAHAELWSMEQRAYFPNGPGDARLAFLKVRVERAEYWLSPGRTAHRFAAAKGAVTGKPVKVVGTNVELP
jgi:hypothetical protein